MEDLVSVVVPVYNAEKYLNECVNSIINQTYQQLEIILVDDGSTDASGRICDEYAAKDTRVKVIHKQNGGNGDARNAGFQQATGTWLVMADNDDVFHPQQIEILHHIAVESDADVAVGNYRAMEDAEKLNFSDIADIACAKAFILTQKHLNDREFIRNHSTMLLTPWGKIWKKSLYDGILFPKKSKHDDAWTTWKAYEKTRRVAIVDEVLYYWRNNQQAFSRVFDISHLDGIDAYVEKLDYYIAHKKQRYIEIAFDELLELFFWCYNRMNENKMNLEPLQIYVTYMRKRLKYLKISGQVSIKQWIRYYYLAYYRIPQLLK